MATERCAASTGDGARCRARPLRGQPECFAHSTTTASAAAMARAAGGAARGHQLRRGPPQPIELDTTEGTPLLDADAVEAAQRLVAVELLAGRLSSREAIARTRVLAALSRRMAEADRAASKRASNR